MNIKRYSRIDFGSILRGGKIYIFEKHIAITIGILLLVLSPIKAAAQSQTISICFSREAVNVIGEISDQTSNRTQLFSIDKSTSCKGRWKDLARGRSARISCSNGIKANLRPVLYDESKQTILFSNGANKLVAFLGDNFSEIRRKSQFAEYAAGLCERGRSRPGTDPGLGSSNDDLEHGANTKGTEGRPSPKRTTAPQASAASGSAKPTLPTIPALRSPDLQRDLEAVARQLRTDEPTARELLTAQTLSNSATNFIVWMIAERSNECAKLNLKYRADCLRSGFQSLSREMAQTGDYSGIKRSLDGVSRDLNRIIRSSSSKRRGPNGYRATKPSGVDQSRQVLLRTNELLRSTPDNDPRKIHYQRIADVFEKGAVILRS